MGEKSSKIFGLWRDVEKVDGEGTLKRRKSRPDGRERKERTHGMLRPSLLTPNGDLRWKMRQTNGRFSFVDVLRKRKEEGEREVRPTRPKAEGRKGTTTNLTTCSRGSIELHLDLLLFDVREVVDIDVLGYGHDLTEGKRENGKVSEPNRREIDLRVPKTFIEKPRRDQEGMILTMTAIVLVCVLPAFSVAGTR